MAISQGAFRHVESELFAYPDTMREIKRIRQNILHPFDEHPDEPGIVKGKNSVRAPGDPTGRTATLLVTDRKLEQLELLTDTINAVISTLPTKQRRMLVLWYWTKPQTRTWEGIALELECDRSTAIRWRNSIVELIAEKMGWR